MSNELIIDVSPTEIVIAHVKDKHLVELSKERSNLQFSVGDIYLGKVKKIMPGLNAAFVDVGYEKDAFLHYLDLGPQIQTLQKYLETALQHKGKVPVLQRFKSEQDIDKKGKISDILKAGQNILVQIAKEPISTKGPRLSSEISIAGRNLVLIPFSDKVSISQKISSSEEKKRLRSLVQSLRPKHYGVIIRTVAERKSAEVIEEELRELVKKWETAFAHLHDVHPPKLFIGEMNRASTILRDLLNGTFSSIFVNDEQYFRDIKDYISSIAPEKEKIVKLIRGGEPILDRFGINKQIKSLFGRTVSIRNGAYLIIEHTEALHVIDVNSGNRTKLGNDQETNALEVNLLAAQHIAQQLRLRDMGGIIVVDFIDMYSAEHRTRLFEKMKEAMSDDRAKHNILPVSKFGLMQITRQRVRPELNVKTVEKCPTCKGSGEVTPSILYDDELYNNIAAVIQQEKLKYLIVRLHPYVAAYLKKGFFSIRKKWARKLNCRIKIEAIPAFSFLEVQYFNKQEEEIFNKNVG
ncbi:MAG: Rne/Rng family ribonuclease [Bacteroidales bacterium]|nr:Rne/Rng family ribonuclease [Bacteroidales bacterium]